MSVGGHFWFSYFLKLNSYLCCALVTQGFTSYMRVQGTIDGRYYGEEVMHCSTYWSVSHSMGASQKTC